MNLASNCRYPLWFPLLCRKWVWQTWSLSSLEWKSTPSITAMFYSQQMLPAIKHVACDAIVFQQDNAPSHRARIPLNSYSKKLRTSDIWPHNSSDLNLVDVDVWGVMQQTVHEWTVSMNWSCALLTSGTVCSRTLLMRPSMTGESNWEHSCMHNILNIYCERVWVTKVMDK